MTETAKTIIDVATALSRWIAGHITAGGEITRQIVPVGIVFGLWHMTPEQQAVLFSAVSGVVAAIQGQGSVAKVRVGERITEKVEKIMANPNDPNNPMNTTTGTGPSGGGTGGGSGSGTYPPGAAGGGTKIPAIVFALILGSPLLAGCGPKIPPSTSPEAKIAIRGTQVIEGLRAVLPQIKALTCQPGVQPPVCIPPKDALMVVNNIDRAGDVAIELGRVLIVIDAATNPDDKTTGLAKARNMLASIQELLTKSILVPQGAEVQTRLQAIFATVSALLFTVM